MTGENSRAWASLLLYSTDRDDVRELDPRVLDQPRTLLGGVHGHLTFEDETLTWKPGFHIHDFHPIAISWGEIWRVELSFMLRRISGDMKVVCGRHLIEFSFPVGDTDRIEDGLARHLQRGQIEVGSFFAE